MNIPTIFDWIERFDYLRGEPALIIIMITSALIALFWDWRLALFALIVQYLVTALLFVDLLEPRLAIIKVFVGMFVCLILYWTARQINYGTLPDDLPKSVDSDKKTREPIILGPFTISFWTAVRTIAVALGIIVLTIIIGLTSFTLPGTPDNIPYINQAIIILMGLGLIGVIVSKDPLQAGMSSFTFLTGFELYYAALDQSVTMLVVLAGLDFVVALVVAYLSQARMASTYKLSND